MPRHLDCVYDSVIYDVWSWYGGRSIMQVTHWCHPHDGYHKITWQGVPQINCPMGNRQTRRTVCLLLARSCSLFFLLLLFSPPRWWKALAYLSRPFSNWTVLETKTYRQKQSAPGLRVNTSKTRSASDKNVRCTSLEGFKGERNPLVLPLSTTCPSLPIMGSLQKLQPSCKSTIVSHPETRENIHKQISNILFPRRKTSCTESLSSQGKRSWMTRLEPKKKKNQPEKLVLNSCCQYCRFRLMCISKYILSVPFLWLFSVTSIARK